MRRLPLLLALLAAPWPTTPSAQPVLLDILDPDSLAFPPQPDDDSGPRFGAALAASGERLLVGAPRYRFDAGLRPGAEGEYLRSGDRWLHVATWVPVNPLESWQEARCGHSLAIAERHEPLSPVRDQIRGCPGAAVLGPNAGGIAFLGSTLLSDGSTSGLGVYSQQAGAAMGQSVAVAQTAIGTGYAALGSPGAELVRIYRRPGGSTEWEFETVLSASDGASGDLFGHSVAVATGSLAGGHVYVVVGAPQQTFLAGAAYVFYRSPATQQWSQVAKLTAPAAQFGDLFGATVAFRSGASSQIEDRIAVGAPNRHTDGNSSLDHRRGTVSLFKPGEVALSFVHEGDVRFNGFLCTASPAVCEDRQQAMGFGSALAFDRSGLWVGAPGYDRPGSPDVGRVYRAVYGAILGDSQWWIRSMLSPGPPEGECAHQPNSIGRDGGRFGSALAATAGGVAVGYPGQGCIDAFPPYTAEPRRGQVWIFGLGFALFGDGFE
jgi:hypothetical protein